jgi:hypothetical protein
MLFRTSLNALERHKPKNLDKKNQQKILNVWLYIGARRRAWWHVGVTSSGLWQHSTYLGAIAYGAEMCYLGFISYGAEQRSKNNIKYF